MSEFYCELLKHYKNDLSENHYLVDEAIATLESYFKYLNTDELIHRSRPFAIAYLALKEIKKKKGQRSGE